jgi:hypothetical protein
MQPLIAPPHPPRQNTCVSAEQLIALEAAQAELGTLYTVARSFTALEAQAEADLLPRLSALGSQLRMLLRSSRLGEREIEQAAEQIHSLRTRWRSRLDEVRTSAAYQRALGALTRDSQGELAELIPQVFSGLRLVHPVPALYFAVSPSTGRRRPGASPFLGAAECADRILQILADGISPDGSGAEWWEHELPSISCADSPAALDTPVSLRLVGADAPAAVFAVVDQPSFRIFTPRLQAPMSIALAADETDEWWQAYEQSYRSFRDALQRELALRGHQAAIV